MDKKKSNTDPKITTGIFNSQWREVFTTAQIKNEKAGCQHGIFFHQRWNNKKGDFKMNESEKILIAHQKEISRSLQIVRKLMAELSDLNDSMEEIETDIVSEANNDSMARRIAMLKAVSLPARTKTLSDLADTLFILTQLERQNRGLGYITCPDTDN